jgi:hypothetical protein
VVAIGTVPGLCDVAGVPCAALTYNTWVDGRWKVEVVDTTDTAGGASIGPAFATSFDTSSQPHLVYAGAVSPVLVHAWRDRRGWHRDVLDELGHTECLSAPGLALDHRDRPQVAFVGGQHGGYRLVYAAETAGGWRMRTVTRFEETPEDPQPAVALGGDGRSWITWRAETGPGDGLFQWSPGDSAAQPLCGLYQPVLAASGAVGLRGARHLALVCGPDGPEVVHAANFDGAWHFESVPLAGAQPDLMIAPDGSPCLAAQSRNGVGIVFSAQQKGAWVTAVVDSAAENAGLVRLGLGPAGLPAIAYSVHDTLFVARATR